MSCWIEGVVAAPGLEPETKYYYRCGDPTLQAMSEEGSFTTLPAPGPASYPTRIAFVGDLGLTYNSTSTVDHVTANNPDLVIMIGDMSYANLYITNGTGTNDYGKTFGGNTPIHETYQPRWDMWQRYSLISIASILNWLLYMCYFTYCFIDC